MEKIRSHENHIFCALVIYLIVTSFINQDLYAFTTVYASLIVFIVLAVMAVPYAAEGIRKKERELIAALATPVLALVFALVSRSGMGAVLIPSDLALICYVAGHLKLTKKDATVIAFAGAAPVILWYSHVRWSYNFNMAGFVFMLTAFFAMILTEEMEMEHGKGIRGMIYITSFLISTLYHSRTAMYGLIVFGILYELGNIMLIKKRVYQAVFLLASAGAAAFTLVYINMSQAVKNLSVLNKEIFSGREDIWQELWEALSGMPLTGIGSRYVLKSFEIFEVHNGMFDILAVHGALIFLLILIQLWWLFMKRYPGSSKTESTPKAGLIALCAALAMMFTSYFENFFIVPPYSILFMAFMVMADAGRDGTQGADR